MNLVKLGRLLLVYSDDLFFQNVLGYAKDGGQIKALAVCSSSFEESLMTLHYPLLLGLGYTQIICGYDSIIVDHKTYGVHAHSFEI